MKRSITAVLLALSLATSAGAQLSDAQLVARRRQPQAQIRVYGPCGNKVVHVAGMTAAGAVAGWLFFTFGIGLLAADHGSEYKRVRNRFVLGGAAFGAGAGLYQVATDECLQPRQR